MAKLSKEEIENLKTLRWRARTDLLWFCNNILGYPDICEETHGPIIDLLQKFPKPNKEEFEFNDVFDGKTWKYRPIVPHQDLPGERHMLLLDPRSHLKTSLNTISHTIQFIINYPNIACMISVANTERAKIMLGGILSHFTTNEKFRQLFPEHCPPKHKADDFGRQDGFTTLARDFSYEAQKIRNEPTVHLGTISKAVASLHFDVIKFSDVVDEENSNSREQCEKIVDSFSAKQPAVVNHKSWVYVEGTRYHNDDLYGQIMAGEEEKVLRGEARYYKIFMRSCFKRKDPTYTLADLEKPFEKDGSGQYVAIFPKKMPVEHLLAIKNDAVMGKTFNEQYLNDPTDPDSAPLPVNAETPSTIKQSDFRNGIKIAYYEMAIDLAETTKERSDFTAMAVLGWSFANKPFVVEILHGKFKPEENLLHIINLYKKYKPRKIYLEDMPYTVGLFVSIEKAFQLQKLYPNWEWVKRRGISAKKADRIGGALSIWWKGKELRFVVPDSGELPKWFQSLKIEARAFPKGAHDDILDTLADLMVGKTPYFGRLGPRAINDPQVIKNAWEKFIHSDEGDRIKEEYVYGMPSWASDSGSSKFGAF